MRISRKVNSKIFVIALVVLLILGLIIGTIAISLSGKRKPAGAIDEQTLNKQPKLIYSQTTSNKFKASINKYILDFFKIDIMGLQPNFSSITNPLLEVFQQAQIPAYKLDKVSEYFANAIDRKNSDKLQGAELIMSKLYSLEDKKDGDGNVIIGPDGNPEQVEVFNPEKNMYKLADMASISNQLNDFMNKTLLTPHEMGKIAYYSTLLFSQKSDREKFLELGEEGFITLLVDTIFSIQLARNFIDDGGTLPESRMVAQLLYQTGSDLKTVIDKLGVDFIAKLIAPDNPFNIFSDENIEKIKESLSKEKEGNAPSNEEIEKMLADITEMTEIIKKSRGSVKFLIIFIKNTLLNAEDISFEYVSRYSDLEEKNRIKYQKLATGLFSKQIAKSLNQSYKESVVKTDADLANILATQLTMIKGFKGGFADETAYNTYKNEVESKIASLLKDIRVIESVIKDVQTIEAFDKMPGEDKSTLNSLISKYEKYDFSYLESSTDFLTVLIMTSALEIYLQSYNLVIQGIPKV